jgi:hypothetical protein
MTRVKFLGGERGGGGGREIEDMEGEMEEGKEGNTEEKMD